MPEVVRAFLPDDGAADELLFLRQHTLELKWCADWAWTLG